jgi:hypothetical protein
MVVNIITADDLEAFKEGFLEELVHLLDQRQVMSGRKWLKTNEVLRLLKISPNTLQGLREKGELPYAKLGGVIYYDFDDIMKMLDNNKTRAHIRGLLPAHATFNGNPHRL